MTRRFYETITTGNRRLIHATALSLALLVFRHPTLAQQSEPETARPESRATAELQMMENATDMELAWLDQDKTILGRFDAAVEPFQMALLGLSANASTLLRPELLDVMHQQLPLKGWHTLSVLMPDPVTGFEADGSTDDNANAEPPATGQEAEAETTTESEIPSAAQRVNAALDFLRGRQVQSVSLLSNARQLDSAVEAAMTRQDFVSGLVLWQVDHSELPVATLQRLKQSRISILDLQTPATQPDSTQRQQLELRRQHFAKAGFVQDYKLITLPDLAPEQYATRRIRHWLENEFRKF